MQYASPNLYAVVLAAAVSFMFGGLWYGALFARQFVAALGKTEAQMKADGARAEPFAVAFVAQLVTAWVLGWVIGQTGASTVSLANSLLAAFLLWVGLVASPLAAGHAFQETNRTLTLINAGHWLGVLLLQGTILGLFGFATADSGG